ncbi:MAG: hypothetical protein ACE5FU_04265, partial [Nitrospinota bacterium]
MKKPTLFLLVLLTLGAISCGAVQKGEAPAKAQNLPVPISKIQGNAVDSLIINGTVSVYALNEDGSFKNEPLATAVTDEKGLFEIEIQTEEKNLGFQITGGSYIDEWSGEVVYLLEGDSLELWVTGFKPGNTTYMITPLTTLAVANARFLLKLGSPLESAITKANLEFVDYFRDIQIASVYPHPWNEKTAPDASLEASHFYGLFLAGISMYAGILSQENDIKITSMAVIKALAEDISSDGFHNGRNISYGAIYVDSSKTVPLSTEALRWNIPLQSLAFVKSSKNNTPFSLDDVLSFFQDLSISKNLFLNPFINPRKIEREDVVPVVGNVDGTVYNCSEGNVAIYEYLNSGVRGKLFGLAAINENGDFKGDFTNYNGVLYLKASCTRYYEWALDRYVKADYPLTALVEVKKGQYFTANISFITTLIQAYHSNKAKFGSADLSDSINVFETHFGIDLNQTPPRYFDTHVDSFSNGHKYGLLISALSQMAHHYPKYVGESQDATGLNSIDLLNTIVRDLGDGVVDGRETINSTPENIFFGVYPFSKYTIRHLIGRAALDIINSDRNLSGIVYKDTINFLMSIALNNHLLFDGDPIQIDEESPRIIFNTKNNSFVSGVVSIDIEAEDISGIKSLFVFHNGKELPDSDPATSHLLGQFDSTKSPDGDQSFLVSVTDNANNTTIFNPYTLKVDNTPPTYNPSGLKEIFSNQQEYSVIGTVTDSGAGGVSFTCDGDSYENINGQVRCTKNFLNLDDGRYILTLEVKDSLGNSKSIEVAVNYDTSPPVFKNVNNEVVTGFDMGTFFLTTTQLKTDNCDQNIVINAEDMIPGTTAYEPSAEFNYRFVDRSGSTSLWNPVPVNHKICVNTTYLTDLLLKRGNGTIEFQATDKAGNESLLKAYFMLERDTTPPTITIDKDFANGNRVNGAQPFTFSASDVSGIRRVLVRLNNQTIPNELNDLTSFKGTIDTR